MMTNTQHPGKWRMLLTLCTAVTFSFIVGCSTTSEPVAEMSAAKTTLQAAEGENTLLYAPVALDRAKQKMRRAEVAIGQQNYEEARRLAEEAQADAELAQAISAKSEVQKAAKELEDSIQVLREEIARARGR